MTMVEPGEFPWHCRTKVHDAATVMVQAAVEVPLRKSGSEDLLKLA
jgi:hypothetical protein